MGGITWTVIIGGFRKVRSETSSPTMFVKVRKYGGYIFSSMYSA